MSAWTYCLVSDIDTMVVDSLKALDPNRPIREVDIPHVTTDLVASLITPGLGAAFGQPVLLENFPALGLTQRSATFSSRLSISGPHDVRGTPMAATFSPALMQPLSHSPARTSFSICAMP
jgi:hypothetical protein